jgi:hypothetical protein
VIQIVQFNQQDRGRQAVQPKISTDQVVHLTGLGPVDPDPFELIGGFRIICNHHPARRIDLRPQGLVLPAEIKKRNFHFS